jgi:hypothetical protein
MDLSSIVNWGTLIGWAMAAILLIGRLLRGETPMHPWVKKSLSSNVLVGIAPAEC